MDLNGEGYGEGEAHLVITDRAKTRLALRLTELGFDDPKYDDDDDMMMMR